MVGVLSGCEPEIQGIRVTTVMHATKANQDNRSGCIALNKRDTVK